VTAVRSIVFLFAFYTWSIGLGLVMLPSLLGSGEGIVGWCRLWHRGTERLLAVICGVHVEIRGREFMPNGPALVAAKHQCSFDAFAPLTQLPYPCTVAKQELMRIPFFAWHASRGSLLLTVNREGHAKALRDLLGKGKDATRRGQQLVIFPEGTRAAVGAAPDYKSGIAGLYAHLEVPCYPVATNAGAHWVAGSILRKPGTIVFQYLPPIPPGLDRKTLMAELQGRIEPACQDLLTGAAI